MKEKDMLCLCRALKEKRLSEEDVVSCVCGYVDYLGKTIFKKDILVDDYYWEVSIKKKRKKVLGNNLNDVLNNTMDEVLSEREKDILVSSTLGYTFVELSKRWHVSQNRVRQIKEDAVKKMKQPRISSKIKPFLYDDEYSVSF